MTTLGAIGNFLAVVGVVIFAVLVAGKLKTQTKWRLRFSPFFPAGFGLLGLIVLFEGKISSRGRGGPPLEGPLAYIGGAGMFVFGVYFSFICYRQTKKQIEDEERALHANRKNKKAQL